MNLVDYPNLAPGVCFICESINPGQSFVDTLRTFEPGGVTHLNGRKYICESCVSDAAQALGIHEDARALAEAHVAEMKERVEQLEADLANFQSIQAAISGLVKRPVVQIEDKVARAAADIKTKANQRKERALDAFKEANPTSPEEQAAAAAAQAEAQKALEAEVSVKQDAEFRHQQVVADANAAQTEES